MRHSDAAKQHADNAAQFQTVRQQIGRIGKENHERALQENVAIHFGPFEQKRAPKTDDDTD